jgi:hypothetical protein
VHTGELENAGIERILEKEENSGKKTKSSRCILL